MIAWLEGNLREKAPTRIVLDVRGVGYELLVPLCTFESLPDVGKTVSLLVHTAVREDAITLYGFSTPLEKELFHLLLKANRVGPKLAQSILSGMEPHRLLRLLRDADAKGLKKAPGVGRMGADDATGQPTDFGQTAPDEELLSALVNLGYPRPQAERVVESALSEAEPGAPLEELIRLALRRLAQ